MIKNAFLYRFWSNLKWGPLNKTIPDSHIDYCIFYMVFAIYMGLVALSIKLDWERPRSNIPHHNMHWPIFSLISIIVGFSATLYVALLLGLGKSISISRCSDRLFTPWKKPDADKTWAGQLFCVVDMDQVSSCMTTEKQLIRLWVFSQKIRNRLVQIEI